MRHSNVSRKRRHPRGSALILAVLIMLAMLALGMMAMRTTTQAMAGTGQQRLARQARYVAELGLYHVATLMNRANLDYLLRRRELRAAGEVLRLRFNSDGTVEYFHGSDALPVNPNTAAATAPVAPFIVDDGVRPTALGKFGENAGLVPSYRVELDGFTALTPIGSSCSEGNAALCPKDCLVEFTATGYIARNALPNDADLNAANVQSQFAQQTLKAVLKVPVSDGSLCQ